MSGFGNIRTDDFIQLLALIGSLIGLTLWLRMMWKSKRRWYLLPAVIATATIAIFYFVILFVSMSIETATLLSAIRTLIDVSMWVLAAVAMMFVQHFGGRT